MNHAQFAMPKLSPIVKWLLIVSGLVFLLQLALEQTSGISLSLILGFVPARLLQGWVWQLVTYSFVHSGMMHLLFNCLILWSIGSELEALWGSKLFSIYYFSCVLGAALAYGLMAGLGVGQVGMPVVGSSGGVYGLLVAYGILYSERELYFFMIFPLKARYFVLILGAMELISSVFYSAQGIAHIAHLGGMITGFAFLSALAKWRIREKNAARNELLAAEERQKRLQKGAHLRLVNPDDKDGPKQWH